MKGNDFDYNKISIKALDENKKLTQEVCQKLIIDEIKKFIDFPNYYQIRTFIDVLSNQLIRFNRNYYLSACTILDSGKEKRCIVRSLIIKKFIELTIQITKGAFNEILNEQKGVQILMSSTFN